MLVSKRVVHILVTLYFASLPGYMPQNLCLHAYFTGQEILQYYCKIFNIDPKEAKHKITEILRILDIDRLNNVQISKWSEGQKRRISLACALIHKPKLILL